MSIWKKKSLGYSALAFGWLLYLPLFLIFSATGVEFTSAISLTVYGVLCLFWANIKRVRNPLPREQVDLVYYSLGILGVLFFTWTQADKSIQVKLPKAFTLEDAVSINRSEIENASVFSTLFYQDPASLVQQANSYLSRVSTGSVKTSCVHDFFLFGGMYGIDNVDTTGTFLRRGIGLNNEFVEEIIHRCYEQFGGKRFKISTFTALIPGGNSDIAPEDMPLEVIHSVQELTRNLHLFLPMRLEPTQATLGEYVEFLIDDEGKILTPETIKTLLDTSRNLPQLPIELAWMDRFIERMQTFFGSDFDKTIWPILAIYLLALKISSRGRSKHT